MAPARTRPGLAPLAVNLNSATITDGSGNAANLSLSGLTQSGPQIDTTAPTVSSVVASGTGITAGAGDLNAGKTVTLTLNLSEAVTVAGGTPTLTLNDGGTATYSGGSGSNALTFSYTVGAGQNTSDLTVDGGQSELRHRHRRRRQCRQSHGRGHQPGRHAADRHHHAHRVVGGGLRHWHHGGAGDLNAGKTVTLTLNLSEAVTVAGGTPTLTLNDGGTATYSGGSGSSALTFSYTVGAGQNTSDLTVTAVNLNSATVTDGAGNAANLTGAVTNPAGTPQIDTTAPTVSSVVASGTGITGWRGRPQRRQDRHAHAQPERSRDRGRRHPDADAQRWRHRDLCRRLRQQCADLQLYGRCRAEHVGPTVTAVNLNSATITDGAGNAANLTGAVTNPDRHAADRHHHTHRVVGGGLRHWHHGWRGRPQRRQDRHAHAQSERSRDRGRRHPDADAQ